MGSASREESFVAKITLVKNSSISVGTQRSDEEKRLSEKYISSSQKTNEVQKLESNLFYSLHWEIFFSSAEKRSADISPD